jgi:hypothetical protein
MYRTFPIFEPRPKLADQLRPVCDHRITHIRLDVTDVDAEYARLQAAGMVSHCPPQGNGALRATYGRDPDGNVIELLEVKDAAGPMRLKGSAD